MAIRTLQIPEMTTIERDALISPKPGMKISNTTTLTEQRTSDGIVWEDIITSSKLSLQSAYELGDGTISVGTGKPFGIIGEDSTDPGKVGLYTPIKATSDILGAIDFDGNNSSDARVSYGQVITTIENNAAFNHSGKMSLSVSSQDYLWEMLTLSGVNGKISANTPFDLLENATFTAPATSSGGLKSLLYNLVADEAISYSNLLKPSSTTSGRVEQVKTSDDKNTPIIAISNNSSSIAGDVISARGFDPISVRCDAAVSFGDLLAKSNTTNGQFSITEGPGAIAVAMQSNPANSVILAAKLLNPQQPTGNILYSEVTGTTANLENNNEYLVNNAALVTLTLPATATKGTQIIVNGLGAGGWKIAQNASQLINVGSSPSTVGITGSVSSTDKFDSITLTCVVANTTWNVQASQGTFTIV